MSESQKNKVQLRQSSSNGKRPLSTYVENDAKKTNFEKTASNVSESSSKNNARNYTTQSISESQDQENEVLKDICKVTLEEVTEKSNKRSWVWKFFQEFKATQLHSDNTNVIETRAYCQYDECKTYYKFTGSTKRLSDHLINKHDLSEESESSNSELRDANKSESNHFNFLLLMFIITSGKF